ncbi:MAG: AAA domain-containing protein [Mesoflavibacter sp.]|nr:AAA domain-containing protein [Mesoflavibacter sp.]
MILQGPPGTGKTRLAKIIAEELIDLEINAEIISTTLKVGQSISSPSGNKSYLVKEVDVDKQKVKLQRESGTVDNTSFIDIIEAYKTKLWEQSLSQNDSRRAAALAKYLYEKLNVLNKSDQFKIVQFHPSYTYEDFVRGIEATSKGDSIEYRSVNKTIGEIAKEALKNYKLSKDSSSQSNIEAWIDTSFEEFKNEIEAKLPETETELSGEITIFEVQKSHFKYAKQWQTPGYLKFDEFKKLIKAVIQGSLELSNRQLDKEKFIHAHYRYTYYNALLKKFFKEFEYKEESIKIEAKKYVLIIDEINRANLSSVLGELVYALEYRGQSVNSMYEVDDNKALNLPPNLYIIGTMNTADRSVGHIDYAIRRRFAFVDVLPRDLSEDSSIIFHKELFNAVNELFTTDDYKTKSECLSEEFEPKDVALGHSYFIDQSEEGGTMDIRLEYEIKPILLEYIKDGILKETAKVKIEELKVS